MNSLINEFPMKKYPSYQDAARNGTARKGMASAVPITMIKKWALALEAKTFLAYLISTAGFPMNCHSDPERSDGEGVESAFSRQTPTSRSLADKAVRDDISTKLPCFGRIFQCAILAFFACAITTNASAQKKDAAKPAAASTQPIVLRGGKLLTITHGVIQNGVLVMEKGKIAAVGAAGSVNIPKNAQIIDATGMTIYPGLIDSESHLGLTEISAEKMTNDLIEPSDEIMPHMHVSDAFHAESSLIPITRYNGITNAIVAPDSTDTLPGQDAFIQLAGRSATDMLLVRDIAMPLNFTGEQRRNESFDKAKFPFTRMGMASQLRQAFLDAQDYERGWKTYNEKLAKNDAKAEPPKRDLKLEALIPYLDGKKPVVLAAGEPNDVETAMRLAKEFNLKIILNHVSHAQPILDEIAAFKVPVIVGPIYTEPHDDERFDADYSLPAQLAKRGVKIAFASYDSHNARNLPYAAGFAVAFGLPYDEALKAITINPAEMWGLSDQLGSLDVGKTANVVVANGDPLDVKTDVKQVYIQGEPVPLVTRQTILRDQYEPR